MAGGIQRTLSLVRNEPQIVYLLRHTFSGASLTPSDLGPSFEANANLPVTGGVLTKSGSGSQQTKAPGVGANVVAQMRVNFGNSAGTDRRAQLRVRRDAGATGDFIQVQLDRTLGNVVLHRSDANSLTTLGSASVTLADSTNYWVWISAVGSRLQVFTSTDGAAWTSRITATESAYVTNQAVEIRLVDNVASPTLTIDDLLFWRAP